MWSRKMAADEKNYVTPGLNSLLIRTGKKTILVETGMGNKLSDRMVKFYGQPAKLLDNLAAAALRPRTSTSSSIRICTSITADGTRSATRTARSCRRFRARSITLPRASGSMRASPSERDSISYHPGQLRSAGRERADDAAQRRRGNRPGDFGEDISRTHGAHAGEYRRERQVKTACYISDLMPTTAHIDLTWGMGFDLYPLDTIESKKEYYARATSGEMADGFHARSEDAVGVHGEG